MQFVYSLKTAEILGKAAVFAERRRFGPKKGLRLGRMDEIQPIDLFMACLEGDDGVYESFESHMDTWDAVSLKYIIDGLQMEYGYTKENTPDIIEGEAQEISDVMTYKEFITTEFH